MNMLPSVKIFLIFGKSDERKRFRLIYCFSALLLDLNFLLMTGNVYLIDIFIYVENIVDCKARWYNNRFYILNWKL